jgi:ubiquitin-like modifier-activating enzyme 5
MTNSNETASNHYMMALKYSNPSIDPEQLCQKCVIILGAGNVGSEIAEKLTRCGIGKLILFDYDIDEVVRARMSVFVPYQENSARVFTLSKKLA